MATISAVAPGARLRRRKNSWRGLSTARCSAATAAGSGLRDRPWRRARRHRRRAAWCRRGSQECAALLGVERAVACEDGAGDGHARRLAATGEQRRGQLAMSSLGLGAAERARQQLAALLGDAAQQLLEERNVHGMSAHSPICGRPSTAKLTLDYNNFATAAFRRASAPRLQHAVMAALRMRGLTPRALAARTPCRQPSAACAF